jgi:hypothetical protein
VFIILINDLDASAALFLVDDVAVTEIIQQKESGEMQRAINEVLERS